MITNKKFPKCVCGNNKYNNYFRGNWEDDRGILHFTILKCQKCNLLRTYPVPKNVKPNLDETLYRINNYNLWQSYAKDLIKLIKRYKKNKVLRVLDIGSNVGIFVKISRDYGFKSVGIDTYKKAVEIGNNKFGIDLKDTSLNNSGFKLNEFDVVVLSHVLEHIYKPEVLLKDILKYLKKDGVIIIEVPNISGLPRIFQIFRKKQWYGYDPRHHVWQYTKKPLVNILNKCDYKILECNTRESLHYENTNDFSSKVRDLILNLSSLLNMADQIKIVAKPNK